MTGDNGHRHRALWIDVQPNRGQAVLTYNDPHINRAAVAALLAHLGLPTRRPTIGWGYAVRIEHLPDVEALAVHEHWSVRRRKPRPA